jgi:hypothetical protein
MIYVVTSTGINKKGEPYSKLVPIIELPNGSAYLDDRQATYVQDSYPLLKRFKNTFSEFKND